MENLRQRCHFFPLCSPGGSAVFRAGLPYLAMVQKTFNPILDRGADRDHHRNLITCNIPWKFQPNRPATFCDSV